MSTIKNWAENLKIDPPTKGKDKEWEKISKRIKTKKQRAQTFWDNKVLWTAVILMAAILGAFIVIQKLGGFSNLFGV
jgi:hypothetical protein